MTVNAYRLGILTGILAGVILVIIFLKYSKKDGSLRCKWDERQLLIRGNGFKYAFFTVLVLLFLYCSLGVSFEGFPLDVQAAGFLIAILGVAVDVVYCIWNGAYFSLNENRKRVLIGFALIGGFNLFIGVSGILHGASITNGVLNVRSANLFCGALFIVIFLTLFLRMAVPEKDGEEEETGE
ncbi:MAG: hypothetical protein MRZ74_09495 [Blautia sp.]|nr:hypothetical protein [Blautia sp.]